MSIFFHPFILLIVPVLEWLQLCYLSERKFVRLGAILERERVREYIHDRLPFGPVLEWLQLCNVLKRYGLFERSIGMRLRRRHMGQCGTLLQYAEFFEWREFLWRWLLVERFKLRTNHFARHLTIQL